jgi:hypothetical protein
MLEPNLSELQDALHDNERIGLLLTASIFGSSALMDELKKEEMRILIFERNIHVVVDICQNVNLINEMPDNYGEHLTGVVSFNDKSSLGVMGGWNLGKVSCCGTG